jgi:hypothetical protein
MGYSALLKGIIQPFELGHIQSTEFTVINWRARQVFEIFFMIQSHERAGSFTNLTQLSQLSGGIAIPARQVTNVDFSCVYYKKEKHVKNM